MKRRVWLSCVVLICAPVAVPLHAACTVSLTAPRTAISGQSYDVLVTPAGAKYRYVLSEEWAGRLFFNALPRATVTELDAVTTSQPFNKHSYSHRTTFDLPVTYRVVATNVSDSSDSCFAEATMVVLADAELQRLTRRGVVPVVGTAGGANGSYFRTSLKLIGNETLHGRLVFHPMAQEGSDSDPSIPYSFSRDNDTLVFEDLMGAFGLYGVGSLDVIPEGDNLQLPAVETRIYNRTDQGTFGTMEPMMIPAEWLGLERPPELRNATVSLEVPTISEGTRVNLGIRSLTHVTYAIVIRHADGTRHSTPPLALQANMMKMGTPGALTYPFPLPELVPGDRVSILLSNGSGIPFYTVNDNVTSDPAINFAILGNVNVNRYSD